MTTATAVARETAWLQTTGDSLPSLLTADGGPWDVVQGYWPAARLATQKHGIYCEALRTEDPRASNQRIRPQYQFTLRLVWPVKGQGTQPGTSGKVPLAETEQQNLDNAVDLLIQRIRGPLGDKTHGGRFLSVAENPRQVTVERDDPNVTIPADKALYAMVSYRADDLEVNG